VLTECVTGFTYTPATFHIYLPFFFCPLSEPFPRNLSFFFHHGVNTFTHQKLLLPHPLKYNLQNHRSLQDQHPQPDPHLLHHHCWNQHQALPSFLHLCKGQEAMRTATWQARVQCYQ